MSDLPDDSCDSFEKIDGSKPSIKKRTTPTISDLKAIVVADNLDQEACEFFSPLASASPLSLNVDSDHAKAEPSEPEQNAPYSPTLSPSANIQPLRKYEVISSFISKNTIQYVWIAVCLISLASTFDLLRAFSISKTEEATSLIAQEKYQEALKSATLAVRCNPFSAKAYLAHGRALVKQLRLKQAFESFNNAIALSANDLIALDQRASLALKLNQPEIAIEDLSKIMSLTAPEPVAAYQYGNRASAYSRIGEYKKALADYDKALKLEPTNYSLQLGAALCLTADKQYAKALKTYTELHNMEPDNNEVLMQKGFCRQCLGDKTGALKDFNEAIKNDSTTARWFTYRANLLTELNQTALACNDFVKAAELDPRNETAQYTAAKLCKTLKQHSLALRFYDRLSEFPNFRTSFEKLTERATLNIAAENYKAALSDLSNALKLKQDPQSLYQQAICYSHLNQPKLAKSAAESATKLSAPTAKAFLYQGQIQALLGDTISAIDHYSQALNLDPNNTRALTERACLYLKREQWASASRDFKRAIALGSSDQIVSSGLSICSQMLGKNAKISIVLPKSFDVDLKKLSHEKLAKDGYEQYNEGNGAIAAMYFAELVSRDPNDSEMRRYLAHSLAKAHNHSEAIAAFSVLYQANKLSAQDKLSYTKELAAASQFDNAIKIIEELRAENPSSISYSYELAQLLAAAGQNKKAIALCASSLARAGSTLSTAEHKNLENLLHSLKSDQNKPVKPVDSSQTKPETEG
jgi:tetratricopeptide (TPR) repeat protein